MLKKLRLLLVIGFGFGSLSESMVAQAAETDDPERLIRTGNDLRRKGDNLRAFGYLQRAFELSGTARAAAQVGLCEQALGRFSDAEAHLTRSLTTNDAWVDANRSSLDASRTVVRKHLGKVQVTDARAGTTVAVGDRPPHRLESDAILWLLPGPVTLVFEAPGFRRSSRTVAPTEGSSISISAELAPERPIATTGPGTRTAAPGTGGAVAPSGDGAKETAGAAFTEADSGVHQVGGTTSASGGDARDGRASLRITGLSVAGAGVGLAITGLVLFHVASNKLAAIDSDANAVPPRPYNSANGNYKTFEGSGIGLMAAGGTAVIVGAALYLLNREPGTADTATAVRGGSRMACRLSPRLAPTFSLSSTPSGGASVGILGLF